MRRSLLIGLALLAACATPPIRLSPAFAVGDERTYELSASAVTIIRIGQEEQRQRTVLRARSTIRVLAVQDEGATMRLTLTPTSFERDGREVAPPPEQVAELLVDERGAVLSVTSVGGVPAEIIGADLQDLAPVLGAPLPTGRVRVGDRWTEVLEQPTVAEEEGEVPAEDDVAPGQQSGQVVGLRVVRGFDAAIVSLATRRPLVRERLVGDQAVQLVGTETSTSEIAFAFRRGFPVEIRTVAAGTFDVGTAGVTAGTVTIQSETALGLVAPQASG